MAKSMGELEAEFFRRKFSALKAPKPRRAEPSGFDIQIPRVSGIESLKPVAQVEKPKSAEEQADAETQKEIDRRFGEGDWWGGSTLAAGKAVGDVAEAPVVKNILDAISVFNYAGANVADENLKDIQEGDWNPISGVANLFEGVGRGLSGAAGNKNDTTTYSDVIRRGQEMAGIDTESKESRAVQGIGGFIGDVALDPTTYIGVGLVKGAIKGTTQAAKFGREANIAKAARKDVTETADYIPGKMTPEYKAFLKQNRKSKVLPTGRFKEKERVDAEFTGQKFLPATNRLEAFKAGAAKGRDDFRESIVAGREARKAKREAFKANDQVEWLAENLQGLRPAVALRSAEEIAKKMADESGAKLTKKELDAATADVLATARLIQKGTQQVIPGTKVQRQVGKGEELEQSRLAANMRRNDEAVAVNGVDNLSNDAPVNSRPVDDFSDPANLGYRIAPDVTFMDAPNPTGVAKGRQFGLFPEDGLKGRETPPIMRNAGESDADYVSTILSRFGNDGAPILNGSRGIATDSQGNLVEEMLSKAAPQTAPNQADEILNKIKGGEVSEQLDRSSAGRSVDNSGSGSDIENSVSNIAKANPEEIALEAQKVEQVERAISQDFTSMTVKLSQYKKVADAQVVYDVLRNIRAQNIDGEVVGDIREITKAMRNVETRARLKKNPAFMKIVEELEPLTGSGDPLTVAKYIDKIAATPEFKAVAKALRPFSQGGRIKEGSPELGFRGSDKYSMGDPEDIAVVKTPATKEEGQAFFNARLEQSEQLLMKVPYAKEVRVFANELFEEAVGNQALKGGTKVTKRKAIQSGLGADKGAKYPQKWNTMASIAYLRSALKYASQPKFKNPQMKDAVFVAVVRNVEDRLRANGVDIHLNNMSPNILRYQKSGGFNTVMTVRLGISDVLEAMGRENRLNVLFNKGNNIPPTVLADTAEMLVRSATKLTKDGRIDMEHAINMAMLAVRGKVGRNFYAREIKGNLDLTTQKNHIYNVLVRMGHEEAATFLRMATKTLEDGRVVPYDIDDMHRYIDETLGDGEDIRGMSVFNQEMGAYDGDTLTPLVVSFFQKFNDRQSPLNQLIYRNMENTSAMGATLLEKARDVTDAKYIEIRNSIAHGSPGQAMEAIGRDIVPPSSANDISLATRAMDDEMTKEFVTPKQKARIKKTNKIAQQNAKTKGTIHRNAANNAKLFDHEASENLEQVSDTLVMDKTVDPAMRQERAVSAQEELYDITYREQTLNVNTGLFGIKEKFSPTFGREISWEAINGASHAHSHIMTAFHKVLNGFAKRGITEEPMRASIKRIQQAHKEGVADSLTGVDSEVYKTLGFMFDPSTNNFFNRNSVGVEAFFKNLREDFGKEAEDLLANVDENTDLGKMWMDWDIKKPYDFLSKMMHTMSRTQEEISMGASFSAKFGSVTKKDGYVKVLDQSNKGEGSEFYNLIDRELYYPKEIANEIPYINKLLTESRYIKSDFVKNALDPIISTLKMTQTTLKPGHHIMSLVGDIWRNSIAGMGGSYKEYGMIGRIMDTALPNERGMDAIDAFGAAKAQTTGVQFKPGPRGSSETLMINGKKVQVGRQELWDLMNQRGVVLPAHIGGVSEDFLTDFTAITSTENKLYGGISKATKGIDNVVNHNSWLNKLAARRDSITRGALFLHQLQAKKFKTLDEAADYAAGVVKKWAPVATDLATWESKYARRAIFYYTWIRGITPRIIEATLTRPGLAMVPAKGMYNLAVFQGIDPMSLGDPFPEDTLMPSWYQERVLGPQWFGNGDMMGISPTSPILDVFNSLGSDVSVADFNPFRGPSIEQNAGEKFGQTLLGMATPWIKAPYEIVTNRRIDSGAPIEDDIQYLTDYIGPARTISKITGKTITGANRSEALYEGGMTPEQSEQNAAHELINWLTGSGLTNYTSDSATKTAEFQLRDALTKQNKLDERLGR